MFACGVVGKHRITANKVSYITIYKSTPQRKIAMKFVLLHTVDDTDIYKIRSAYNHPSVSRFIDIDKNNYWSYVTEAENVYFYKIFNENELIAAVHCETDDRVLYLAIVVFPEYQKMGIGTSVLKAIENGNLNISFDKIRAYVEPDNTASLALFEKANFNCIGKDEELFEYEYTIS